MKFIRENDTKVVRLLFELIQTEFDHKYARDLWLSDKVLEILWREAKDPLEFKSFVNSEIKDYIENREWQDELNDMYETNRED